MAGVFTSQNKVRPGAYIVFKSIRKSNMGTGTRGTVMLPMVLPWGPVDTAQELTVQQFLSGATQAKLGLAVTDPRVQPLREAFKNAFTVKVFRLGQGATPASATLMSGVIVTAKYPGTLGNSIEVSVVVNNDAYDVITSLNGLEVDRQTCQTVSDFKANDYISLSGSGALQFQATNPMPTGISALSVTPVAQGDLTLQILEQQTETPGTAATGEISGLTFTAAQVGANGNMSVTIKATAQETATAQSTAVWDADTSTLTFNLAKDGGTAGVYDSAQLTALLTAVTGLPVGLTITGDATFDANVAGETTLATGTLTGGADATTTSELTLQVVNSGTVLTQVFAGTGTIAFNQGGVSFNFDAAQKDNFVTAQLLGTTAATTFTPVAGIRLLGGVDGLQTAAAYPAFLDAAARETWTVLAAPTTDTAVPPLVTTFIKELRENAGQKVQAVVYNYSEANYEGIISVDQGYVLGSGDNAEEVPVTSAICWVAGMTAGAELNASNTYKVVEGATRILGAKTNAEIVEGLTTGKLIFSQRQDRAIVVEKDINTLYRFTEDRSYVFSKNRVIRCLDDIATQVAVTFENSYIGKVDNTQAGRTLFKGDIIGYLNSLQGLGAIQNFDPTTDIEVLPGDDIESVVCNLWIQTVDAMEKLYMTVVVS